MAFTKEPTKTPAGIGQIEVRLVDQDPADPFQGISYRIEIVFADGSREFKSGELRQHLTTTQVNQLLNFLTALRTKATAEFIG